MSGTPAPNSEQEYWAQAEFLQPGVFGNFFKFRNVYFHLSRGNQTMQGQFMTRHQAAQIFSKGWKYSITAIKRQELMALIAPLCSRLQKADCLDLPEQIDEVREVEMTANQKRIYKEMKSSLITEIRGKDITAQVALAKLMKLREISSGFAYDERGEAHAIPGPNPKLNELFDVIEEAGDQQVIVWANFTWEIDLIVAELSKIAPARALNSTTKDRDQVIQDFIGGSVKYLVAHPRSAAHGLTFVNCSLQVFFSLDYSWESHEQARARTHRAGQKKNCTYVYLIAKGTIDEDILATLRRKGDAQEILWNLK
jgi:SNF2 family DNA or RNA helicase